MKLVAVTDDTVEQFSPDIPELMWSTGPISYEYHFGKRELFDAVALGSWRHRGSLFGFDAATVAIKDGQLAGVEIGMKGGDYRDRQAALGPVWQKLIADGDIDPNVIPGVLQRSDHASWLNPVLHADTYYVHALAVKPEFRGKRIGYQLIDGAINRAKEQGFKRFQLDVLSDNPAVEFYRAVGLELLAETRAPKPAEYGVPPEYRMGMNL